MKTLQRLFFKRSLFKLIAVYTASVLVLGLNAQNLNTPNKPGPMGINVNTLTGNMFLTRTDINVPGRGFPITASFSYNSVNAGLNKGFGNGWQFIYNIHYALDSANAINVSWGDGRDDHYAFSAGNYISPFGIFDKLTQYQPGKFLLQSTNGTQFYFDDPLVRKITKMQDPNGNYISFGYTNGAIVSVSNNAGQNFALAYSNGLLQTLTDKMASPTRVYNYSYDGFNNLIKVVDPVGNSIQYSYLTNGPMSSMTDKNGNLVNILYFSDFSVSELITCNNRLSFSYDETSLTAVCTEYVPGGQNRLTTYTYTNQNGNILLKKIEGNCCGYNVQYSYDNAGNAISKTDANGNTHQYSYDSSGNTISEVDPQGNRKMYTYTPQFNRLATVTDPLGNLYTYQHDNAGNLLQLAGPNSLLYKFSYSGNGDLLTTTDPNSNVWNYTHDNFGFLNNYTSPLGHSTKYIHDGRGRVLSETDPLSNTSTSSYDGLARLKSITNPLGNTISQNYDANGNRTSYTDAKGQVYKIGYDASNRPVSITTPLGQTTQYEWNTVNNLTAITDPLGKTMSMAYDNLNRLTQLSDALGNKISYGYDGNGNLVSKALPNGNTIIYTYDNLDRMIQKNDNYGTIAAYQYDANGNLMSYTNALGAKVSIEYDAVNRPVELADAVGNKIKYGYDNNSNLVKLTDRNGNNSQFSFDAENKLIAYSDNNGSHTQITFDGNGNTTALTDANGNTTRYVYDALNRPVSLTYANGSTVVFNYDANGNLVTRTLPDGKSIQYQYDAVNRVTQRQLPDGNLFRFTYDAANRYLGAGNNAGTLGFAYDAIGRLLQESNGNDTVRYAYNDALNTSSIVYADGTGISRYFDGRNRLTGIYKGSSNLLKNTYNNADKLSSAIYSNGVSTGYQYDYASRLTLINAGNILNFNFSYDNEQNFTSVGRPGLSNADEQFSYDAAYRLVGYKRGQVSDTYTYDPLGNRSTTSSNGQTTAYAVNNLNQYQSIQSGSLVQMAYDANGNLSYDGNFYKRYDEENRLLSDSNASIKIAYSYDAMGRRVFQNINGKGVRNVFAGLQLIEQHDAASDALLAETIFGAVPNQPVSATVAGKTYWYHGNILGSPEAISDSAGHVAERYLYDAYGKQQVYDSAGNQLPGSAIGNTWGFTGQLYDTITHTNHFFYREYSPQTGAFAQRDPIGYADGLGIYQYVHNNPVNRYDSWGLEEGDEGNNVNFSDEISTWSTHIAAYASLTEKETAGNTLSAFSDATGSISNLIEHRADFNWQDATATILDVPRVAAASAGDFVPTPVNDALEAASDLVKATNDHLSLEDRTDAGLDLLFHSFEIVPGGKVIWEGYDHVNKGFKFITGNGLGKNLSLAGQWLNKNYNIYDWAHGGSLSGRIFRPLLDGIVSIIGSHDPNELYGPIGVNTPHWVARKNSASYSILFQNNDYATAPAKLVRVNYPIDPKQDLNNFSLGSFGFNNQVFTIPSNTPSYYQRLDVRDSLGLYVDITAGLDLANNQIFWIFQSIDPTTLQPPTDPLKGFLLLTDTTGSNHLAGQGFVNFNIAPLSSAITGDSIHAIASIVFDQNDTVPTNVVRNTIDAVGPTTKLTALAAISADTVLHLHWSGTDDPGGSGLQYYTLYMAIDSAAYTPLDTIANFTNDTAINGKLGSKYSFFVLGTDSVGNTEIISPNNVTSTLIQSVALPVTWLYFTATLQGNNGLLNWATATETNAQSFVVQRSADGLHYSNIATVKATGNSTATQKYNYVDPQITRLGVPLLFYRLMQVDKDGATAYSNIQTLSLPVNTLAKNIIIYPNPYRNTLNVYVQNIPVGNATETAQLFSLDGKLIYSSGLKRSLPTQQFTINNLPALTSGTYILKLTLNAAIYSYKVMKE